MYVVLLSIHVCAGGTGAASVTQVLVKEVVGGRVPQVDRPRLPPRVLGDSGAGGGELDIDRVKKLSVASTVKGTANRTGCVVLPDNVDAVLSDFLGDKLTKKKSHKDTTGHINIWKTFHEAKLGGSRDYWLENCANDEFRAKVWSLFMTELYELNIREKRIQKILSGVKHQFEVNLKSTSFLSGSELVMSMKKAIKPMTSQIREEAIANSQHVKLPMPAEVMDRAHEEGWTKSAWNWEGTLRRGVSVGTDLTLCQGFRASNVAAPGKHEEDHAVRYSDVVFLVKEGSRERRVVAGPSLTVINEVDIVSLQGHVYSTKTGAVLGGKIPYTVTRDTVLGDRVVSKVFSWMQRMVQAPNFNIEDPLCTVYRMDKNGTWHRRLIRRADITNVVKENAVAFGIPEEHAASSSLRKAQATDMRLTGGDDQAVADVGRWATDKNGRSHVAGRHYDLSAATGRGGATAAVGVTVNEVLNMVPLRSRNPTRDSVSAAAGSVVQPKGKVAKSVVKAKGKSKRKKTAIELSPPKTYKKK